MNISMTQVLIQHSTMVDIVKGISRYLVNCPLFVALSCVPTRDPRSTVECQIYALYTLTWTARKIEHLMRTQYTFICVVTKSRDQ